MLWVIPVLILVMLKAYIIHHFAPRLHNSPHAFYYAFILNQVIFLFVDVLVLQESGGAFIQHFCMFNLFMLSFMYIEARPPQQPGPVSFRSTFERADRPHPPAFSVQQPQRRHQPHPPASV